jgi:hypothetical protein
LGRGSAPFSGIALCASTDKVFPCAFAAENLGNYVVERKLSCVEFFTAVLAGAFVPCENISSVQLYLSLRQTIVKEQPDNFGNRNITINGADPVVIVRLKSFLEFAYLAPRMEVVIFIKPGFAGNNFSLLMIEHRNRSFDIDNTERHIVLVKNKYITTQRRAAIDTVHIHLFRPVNNTKPKKIRLNGLYLGSFGANIALRKLKFNIVPFMEQFKAFALDVRVMNKNIRAVITLDKAVTFFLIKPFDCTASHR